MTRLPQMTLQFNRKLKISNEGDELSSDTGQFLFREFDEKLGFTKTIFEYLQLKDERSFHVHQNKQLFRQKIYKMTSGYHEDDAADQLTHDPVFTQVIGTPALASQPSLSRFYKRFNEQSLDQLQAANQALLDKVHEDRQADTIIFDFDSTHSDTYGKQEQSAYNAHYGTVGFHPLVAFDGLTGDFLKT